MTRSWERSLLFSIFVAAFIFSFLLICTSIECASASEPQIDVTPREVKIFFDSERASEAFYPAEDTITITNNGENTTVMSISHDSKIILSCPDTFSLDPKKPKVITIKAPYDAHDGSYYLEIKAGGVKVETVTVKIIYCAKIKVNLSSVDFGEVPSKKSEVTKTIEISEEYGYKTLDDVTITPARGNENNWVTPSRERDITVSKVSHAYVTFTLRPGPPNYNRRDNKYRWMFIIKSRSRNVEPITIEVEARIMRPPKLGELKDKELEIKFDKPKETVLEYYKHIDIRVRNEGDEPLYFRKIDYPNSLGGGIRVEIDPPDKVLDSRNIEVYITVPYYAPEGTYRGKLHIYAEDKDGNPAGDEYVDITIKIIWPVDFTISSTSPYFTPSPPSIDFGSLALKERGYEKKSVKITLTERYGYKPVRNLRFSESGEYGEWLHEELDFSEIPPGESRSFILKIEPGLEAVPKSYSWKYDIRASEISRKRIEVKANIVPMNIPEMMEYLESFRESILYRRYPSSEAIISNGVGMLEVVERSDIGAEDWKKIPVLMKGTLSLLSSLNDGLISSEGENYGKAVENLVSASVSASTIESNSELNNWDIYGYAREISAGADRTTEEVLMDEAKKLELRGWNIKKAVEHAMAMGDISGLKEEENVLESALSYQYAAIIYGLLDNKEKRLECSYEESLLMDKHDELVSDATDLRIKAEGNISISKENDLVRIGDLYLLVNPYKFDTFSANFGSAKANFEDAGSKYKVAGELLMSENTKADLNELRGEWSRILSMFFLACILYCAAFIYTINRIIMGTMAYMMDMHEREVGDIVVTTTVAF